MGNTFGCIHIRTSRLNEVKQAILHNPASQKLIRSFPLESNTAAEIMDLIHQSKSEFILSDVMVGWISVLHYDFEGEFVHDYALQLSHKLPYPIVSVFYFDDEFFQLYITQHGEVVTSYISGDLDGDERILPDPKKMKEVLQLDASLAELEEIFLSEDMEEQVSQVEHILQVPIWGMGPDAVEDFDEEVRDKFHRVQG
jgi:hypothetical protein